MNWAGSARLRVHEVKGLLPKCVCERVEEMKIKYKRRTDEERRSPRETQREVKADPSLGREGEREREK